MSLTLVTCHQPNAEHDLQAMYSTRSKEIVLWCDGKSQDMGKNRKKTNDDKEEGDEDVSAITKRTKSEERELEDGIHKLHSDEYDYGQYRLWARMIRNNKWKDFDNPPNVPMITGKVSCRVVNW